VWISEIRLPKLNWKSLTQKSSFGAFFEALSKYRLSSDFFLVVCPPFFMKADLHPEYVESSIRCACGNEIKTRSTKPTMLIGICNECHPFYTGQQKFVDTAGRVDKFQQRLAKTKAAREAAKGASNKKSKNKSL
jgi:large subunit ribosomal protein L31